MDARTTPAGPAAVGPAEPGTDQSAAAAVSARPQTPGGPIPVDPTAPLADDRATVGAVDALGARLRTPGAPTPVEPTTPPTDSAGASAVSAPPQAPSTPAVDPVELLADPYAAYARLREAGSVHRIAGTDGLPAWLVTRYEDVRQALADPRLSLDKAHAAPGGYRGLALPPALDANLLNMDPPDHTRVRRLVSQAFTPWRVARLREPVRRTADTLLDALAPPGRTDLIAAYAAPLPIAVICELLGVPESDRPDFRSWTDALVVPDPARPERAKEAVGALLAFFARLLARKGAEPADDLLSAMIAVRDEEDRLSEDELMSLAFLILFAGYENTVHLIGNATLALLRDPAQLAALRADPARIGPAVEELARYDGPGGRDRAAVPGGGPSRPAPLPRARPAGHRPGHHRAPGPRSRHPLLPRRTARPPGDRDRPDRSPGTPPRSRTGHSRGPVALASLDAHPGPAGPSGAVLREGHSAVDVSRREAAR